MTTGQQLFQKIHHFFTEKTISKGRFFGNLSSWIKPEFAKMENWLLLTKRYTELKYDMILGTFGYLVDFLNDSPREHLIIINLPFSESA